MPDSMVYADSLSSYDVMDVSGFHHERINHGKRFADGRTHINGIENFWNQAKRILRKYNGIRRKSFPLFLKECEFRFNYGSIKRADENSACLVWSLKLSCFTPIFFTTKCCLQ